MSAHRFIINSASANYQTILDLVSIFGPARAVFYRVKSGSSPAEADYIELVLWNGDVIDAALDDSAATRPLISTLLTDFPMAVAGYIAGIAV